MAATGVAHWNLKLLFFAQKRVSLPHIIVRNNYKLTLSHRD